MIHQYITYNITQMYRRLFKSLCNLTILRVKHIKVSSNKFGDFNFTKSVSNAKIVKI